MQTLKNSENMRRPRAKKQTRRDIDQAGDEIRAAERDAVLAALEQRVLDLDAPQKALTGRPPEKYALESGIPLDELFPEDARILNIGDPWQKLDLPGVTSIDYESGEEAEFVHEPEAFLGWAPEAFQTLINIFESYQETKDLATKLAQYFDQLKREGIDSFDRVGQNIITLTSELPKENPIRTVGDHSEIMLTVDLWHTMQRLGRGLRDIWLIDTVIEPKIREERVARNLAGKHLSVEEEKRIRDSIIHDNRFVRRMKQADLIKAAFPNVPFDNHSFDRITASWSISTHVFPVMSNIDFRIYWEEIDRLLKKDGICMMWPIYTRSDFGFENISSMSDSLYEYYSSGGDACLVIFDEDGNKSIVWVDQAGFTGAIDDAATLVIFARGTSSETKNRFIEKTLAFNETKASTDDEFSTTASLPDDTDTSN